MTIEDIYSTLVAEDMIISLESPPRPQAYGTPTRGRRGRGRGRGGGSTQRRAARAPSETPDEDPEKPNIPKRYTIRFDRAYVEAVMTQHESRGYLTLKHDRLKYHPFLVSRDPVKPPGFLAKATLTAGSATNGPDPNGNEGGMVQDDPEIVNHGQDEATLQLVAKLSESPVRSLRKRPASGSEPASIDRSRPKRARRTMNQVYGHIESPRRSTRGSAMEPIPALHDISAEDDTPLTTPTDEHLGPGIAVSEVKSGGLKPPVDIRMDMDLDDEEDVDPDLDAEGEDEDADGEWEEEDPDLDAEGEDEYVE